MLQLTHLFVIVIIGKLDFTGKIEQVILAARAYQFPQGQIDQFAFGTYPG
jgi:hypothetical protein